MGVDAFIFMFLIHMALFARDLFFWVDGVVICNHAPEDLVIFCPVAVNALHIVFATHVDVVIFRGEVQTFVEVTVFDAVSAAAIKVTAFW